MSLLNRLWTDQSGLVLTAEAVVIGTLGVIGATVGLSMAATSVDEELQEMANAIRSLDQSYMIPGFSSGRAWKAGSSYQQQDVAVSLAELRKEAERKEADGEKETK